MKAVELKFEQMPRNGAVSLWVNDLNIWDLDKKDLTPDVMKAIQSAVERGMQIMRHSIREAQPDVPYVHCGGVFEAMKVLR